MHVVQVMVNRDGVLTIKGERKFEVPPAQSCVIPYSQAGSWLTAGWPFSVLPSLHDVHP